MTQIRRIAKGLNPMPSPLLSPVGFTLWTILVHVAGIGAHRWSRIPSGRSRLSVFPGDVPHGPDRCRRMVRAHATCVENLPHFASLVLAAEANGYRSAASASLCLTVLVARVARTAAHVASGSDRAIAVRFLFFAVQSMSFLAMLSILLPGRRGQ